MAPLIFQQIKSLLYRNFLLKTRTKAKTIQEVAMPIYFVVLLVVLKLTAYKPTFYSAEANTQLFPLTSFSAPINTNIYVAPNLPNVNRLIGIMKAENPNFNFSVYESQSQMDAAYASSNNKLNIVGLYFNNNDSVTSYVLRFQYDSVPNAVSTDFNTGSCRQSNNECPADNYLRSGFTFIQNAVDTAIIKIVSGNNNYTTPNISVQRFPRESGISNAQIFQVYGSVYLVIAFVPFMSFLISQIVHEKETKIREGMELMGLERLAFWIAWGITYTVLLLVIAIIITILAVSGQLYPKSHFFLIFLLFFLYGLSLISFGFMLTPFFSHSKSAGGFACLLLLLMGALSVLPTFITLPDGAIWAICLLSPTAFGTAISQISLLEATVGAHFSNLWQGPTPVAIPLIMLAMDILLYFVLAVYFDQVVPGEYGQKRSPIFFLLPSFWCPSKHVKPVLGRYNSEEFDMENMEPVSEELAGKEGIRIRNLTKVYGSDGFFTKQTASTTAVKNFSLDIYEGQITALLGHNGAGKTTLFNILTGIIDSISGSASVYGYDVSNAANMSKIRQMTGVCPQKDIPVVLDIFSVEEHLEVFAGIKGLSKEQTKSEIDRVIKLVGLEIQRHTLGKKLSGGQVRKLSVGIAILGDPKILILDEPTAGMDPFSRKTLWDVLRSRKKGRVTLFTTHFMDEADILAANVVFLHIKPYLKTYPTTEQAIQNTLVRPIREGYKEFVAHLKSEAVCQTVGAWYSKDRKAIISRGRLRCVGSSLFLKNKFGAGYHLGVVTNENNSHAPMSNCVKNHVTGAKMHRSIGFELDYTLPLAESHKFADLFHDLEENMSELGVQSFGVSMTTLEEVFLKIGEEDEADGEDDSEKDGPLLNQDIRVRFRRKSSTCENPSCSEMYNENETDNDHSAQINVPDGVALVPSQSDVCQRSTSTYYKAMWKRLFLIRWRNPAVWIFYLMVPVGFAIGSAPIFNLVTIVEDYTDPPIILINPDLYNDNLLYKNSTGSSLANFASSTNSTLVPNNLDNLTNFVATNYMASDIFQFGTKHLSYKAIYNTKGVHSLPSILNLFSSAALSQANQSLTEIITQQKRWPRDTAPFTFIGGVVGGTIMAGMALVIATSFSALNPIQERELKIFNLMRVSGVRFAVYWGSSFSFDYAWYLIVAVTLFIAIKAFNVTFFVSGGAVAALIFLLIGFGASAITTSYCISHLFTKYKVALGVMPNVMQLIALLPYIAVSQLDQQGSANTAMIVNAICAVFIPYYTALSGLYYIVKVDLIYKLTGNTDAPPSHVYFDWSNPMVLFAILMCYVHLILLLLLLRYASIKKDGGSLDDFWSLKPRSRAVRNTPHNSSPSLQESDPDMDDDVLEEKEKASQLVKQDNSSQEQPVVLFHDLRKEFVKPQKKQNRKKPRGKDEVTVAVDQLSLSVYRGQVLGLLGPNGAGKTTAMNLITADFAPTRGKVFVSGQEVLSNLSEAFMDMGYCPQNNPLWEDLTLMEHLEIYASIQGVKKHRVKSTIEGFVKALGIEEHVNKRAKALSGGTKRKLCFAIAMLGNPQVVLLDEPSTGMDPKSKRFMWDMISKTFQGTNRGAILNTHYMEEADALCSRVAIMVSGKLRCIGSTQHLKRKFGQGYILEVKLKHSSGMNDVGLRDFVRKLFPGVSEPKQFCNRFVYKIAHTAVVSLSSVFQKFERAKDELGIEEYSFSQPTMEQVFLQFAREQKK